MTEPLIPPQSTGGGGGPDPLHGRPPVNPQTSDAGRFLCAGTYLDATYRDQVIDELFVHEERIAAPSYGFDATRVLAHALRARRVELAWAAGVLGAWFVGFVLTGGILVLVVAPFLLLSLGRWLKAREALLLRFLSLIVRIYAWWLLIVVFVGFWVAVAGSLRGLGNLGSFLLPGVSLLDDSSGSSGSGYGGYDDYGSSGSSGSSPTLADRALVWWVPAVYAAVVTAVGLQRGHAARIISTDLSEARYAQREGDPAESSQGARFARVSGRIRREQHSPLIMYNINDPFTGSGEAYRPWHLSVELRPREDLAPGRTPDPLTNADIVRRIEPFLHDLRVPSPHGSPQAADAVLDRLRALVVDQCVFLPAGGLPHRDGAPLSEAHFAEHLAGAIEEGGERRRYFLRVRVGGWDENLGVTVFVRVHTQGHMLMLEVAPHLLLPVRTTFHNADADAQRHLNNNWLGKAAEAVAATPSSVSGSVVTLARGAASWWRIATGGHGGARPEGPGLSVREIAAEDNGSLFHLMDIDRYLKTIQDRVVRGVTVALHDAGWYTEEFAQRAVTVAAGGVFIQSVNDSAFSVGGSGHHNTAGGGSSNRGSGSGH
ncbi:hypothetical protein OOK31_13375 [Streptomyces sp. NBC_00249]|uniref:hypothetical protein n=1 Tax=Streptomyces sp. NBC_00249 TaxID=2975690 RepID=UPI0022598CA5|nr:hypothetical protein [Streptomyces sp. NBC_00249]MCX5194879.1 hypothetical protein [Streptomyces sp. NBC_00249]